MPTSFRLDPETEATLERLARERDTSKSQIVREAVAAYGVQEQAASEGEPTLYDRMKDLIGKFPSGQTDLSVDTGRKVRALLVARYETEQAEARAAQKKPRKAGRKPSR